MLNFDNETLGLIPGKTPKQKNENTRFLIQLVTQLAYPRRGTLEEGKTREEFAREIIERFPSVNDLIQE